MKSIIGICIAVVSFTGLCSANDEPRTITLKPGDQLTIVVQDFPASLAPVVESLVAEPVYETVYELRNVQVCDASGCRIVQQQVPVRRLIAGVARAAAPVYQAPLPMAMYSAPFANYSSPQLSAPVGYHSHQDSSGFVWTHSDSNQGIRSSHISPMTGQLVYRRLGSGNGTLAANRRTGRFVRSSTYAATGVRTFPLLNALAPKSWFGVSF